MPGQKHRLATTYWHQGFATSTDAKGRECVRFLTYGIALQVQIRAAGNGFRLGLYPDDGDWCLRLLGKDESVF
jgi:hypothetical protein